LLLESGDCGVMAAGLADFSPFRIAGDDLHVEPEEMGHLVEADLRDWMIPFRGGSAGLP